MENEENNNKDTFFERLKRKYRLIIYSESDYETVYQVKYSRFLFVTFWLSSIIIFIAIIFCIVAFTPVKELIPGYPTTSLKRNLIYNARLVDSLEYELQLRDQYFANIHSLVTGKEPKNFESQNDSLKQSDEYNILNFIADTQTYKTNADNEFSSFISNDKKIYANISSLHFFAPVKGMITNKFNASASHFGTDIVASSDEVVKAILPGTVTLAAWTLETGHVIQLQHDYNLVSVYKHNAELLKKVGVHVDAGEPIAIIGNSGELTTGPHLHFELWHNMIPIDPEDFINF